MVVYWNNRLKFITPISSSVTFWLLSQGLSQDLGSCQPPRAGPTQVEFSKSSLTFISRQLVLEDSEDLNLFIVTTFPFVKLEFLLMFESEV